MTECQLDQLVLHFLPHLRMYRVRLPLQFELDRHLRKWMKGSCRYFVFMFEESFLKGYFSFFFVVVWYNNKQKKKIMKQSGAFWEMVCYRHCICLNAFERE